MVVVGAVLPVLVLVGAVQWEVVVVGVANPSAVPLLVLVAAVVVELVWAEASSLVLRGEKLLFKPQPFQTTRPKGVAAVGQPWKLQ